MPTGVYKRTEKHRKINSQAHQGQVSWMKGKRHGLESRKKISLHHRKFQTKETRLKISKTLKGKKPWNTGKHLSLDHKLKISKHHKKTGVGKWMRGKILTEAHIKNIIKGSIQRPTSLEKQMIEIIKKHNLPYRYTGDGSFLIGYKNPDFVNINGEKKLIEVGNTFHHKPDYIKKRSDHFKKYGWKSMIFLTNKLNEIEVLSRLG